MSTKYIASNWRLLNEENSNKNDNYGLSFDGSSEYINCGNISHLSNVTQFSISGWYKFDNTSRLEALCANGGNLGGGNYNFLLQHWPSNNVSVFIASSLTDSGSNYVKTNNNFITSTSEWYHITVVYDGSLSTNTDKAKIYVNGNDVTVNGAGTIASSTTNTTGNFNIGQWEGIGRYFDGSISELAIFDYALSESQISTLYGSSSLGAGNPMAIKRQPVGYWPLGDNSASNPLTQPNEAVEDASVFDFDGSNQYIDCGNNTSLNITNDLSVSVWFKTTNNGQIVTKDTGLNGTRSFAFGIVSGKINITVRDQDGSPLLANTTQTDSTYNDGNWHHAVFTYLPSTSVKIYIDGNLVKTNTSGIVSKLTDNPNTKLAIGSYQNGAFNEDFNGEISNAQIWNTELTSTEVTTLYNSGVPLTGTQPQASNLKAWYKLDQSANWEADSSGNWQIPDAVSAYPQSFDFDGSSNYIAVPNSSNFDFTTEQEITVSAWVKGGAGLTNTIAALWIGGANKMWWLFTNTVTVNLGGANISTPAVTVSTDEWHHIAFTYSQADGELKHYVDTVASTTSNSGAMTYASGITELRIGYLQGGTSRYMDGQISNLQIWNTALPATGSNSIETLYNNGVPLTTAIATDNLKAWYKLDNSATFSTNWSIPDASGNGNTGTSSGMTEQNLVNNNVSVLNGESSGMTSANLVLSDLTRAVPYDSYSFNFDGSLDYIDCGNNSSLNINGDLTISAWVYIDAHKNYNGVVSKISGTDRNFEILFRSTGKVSFYTQASGGTIEFTTSTTITPINTWTNLIITVESGVTNGTKFYFNGVQDATTGTHTVTSNTANLNIGRRTTGGFEMDGKISNISLFNEELTSTEVLKLYSNGVPQDLTNFTPQPVAWWPLGSNSFWNGSAWTVRDMSTGGSNDGTGQNIGQDGLVGDAPRSQANGTGTNMDVPTNLEGNTKWSDNNSWSINMSSTARVEDTP